jgi:hypothetical protein
MQSPEAVEAINVVIQHSTSKATRKAAGKYEMYQCSGQSILQTDLKMFPYKISAVHKLSYNNKERQLQFAAYADRKEAIIFNTPLSVEACFNLDGTVSKVLGDQTS